MAKMYGLVEISSQKWVTRKKNGANFSKKTSFKLKIGTKRYNNLAVEF